MRGKSCAFLALVIVLLVAPSIAMEGGQAAGQSSATSTPTRTHTQAFVLQIQRNEVLVDVRVLDKHGNPVKDLKQSDFRVFEDGKTQTISSFSLENIEQLGQASAENGAPKTIDLSKLPPNVSPGKAVENHRLLVLFLDMTSMQVDDVMRALKSAATFVNTRVTPADLVAIVTYTSDLRVVQDFTNDRDELDKALKSIQLGESSSLADMGAQGAAGGADENGEEIVTQDTSDAFTPDETEFNILD